MTWISVKDRLPEKYSYFETCSIEVLISDGKNIGIGYHEFEYFGVDSEDLISYSSPVWNDYSSYLNTDVSGYAKVTHWMPLPLPPESTNE